MEETFLRMPRRNGSLPAWIQPTGIGEKNSWSVGILGSGALTAESCDRDL